MAVAFIMTLPGLVVGLGAVATLDRLGWRLHEQRGPPWHRDGHRPATAVGLDEVQTVVQPGKTHVIEQRRLELVLAEEDEDGAPPRVHVDLDRQIAIIRPSSGSSDV